MKMRNDVVTLSLATTILLSMLFSSLPLVSAAYTVENPYMPYPGEPVCAMKTKTDGSFYIPNLATDLLKVEMLFDNQDITGDQTGGASPYSSIENYPNGAVDIDDVTFIAVRFGKREGQSGWDYMADVTGPGGVPDGVVDIDDITAAAINFGKYGDYIYDLSGVTVTFNTGEERTPDTEGFITIPQDPNLTGFTVKQYGDPIGAMITFWQIGDPVAYSTTFEFTVPNDGDNEVWYYVLAMVYVPSELSGENFYFVATADDDVQNVMLDETLKAGSGSSVNIDLGTLSGGYHLLEFEFVEVTDGGSLNFNVTTATEEYAWLVRFRIYVPYFSNNKYEYGVTTQTCLTYLPDEYFLIGYADDYITDISGGVHDWSGWEWSCSPYDTIYAWEDGFRYPLGPMQMSLCTFSFVFGEINESGLLDFQYISWKKQQDKIGPPIFCGKTSLDPADHVTINRAMLYGGSMWNLSSDPEFSERFHEVRKVINATYDDGEMWLNTYLELGLGVGWAEWALLPATQDDIGVTMNLTYMDIQSNKPVGWVYDPFPLRKYKYWCLQLYGQTLDIYSFPSLQLEGLEFYDDGESKVKPDLTALDYAGTLIMFIATVLVTKGVITPVQGVIGSSVGVGVKGIAAFTKVSEGQEVCRCEETISEYSHRQLSYTHEGCLWTKFPEDSLHDNDDSDFAFFKLNPTAGKNCGSTRVVLKGTLLAYYCSYDPMNDYVYASSYPIGDIEIAIYIPWFLRG